MASRDFDRPKAMGWAALASSAGLILGPLLQLIFTRVGYPGWNFIFDKIPYLHPAGETGNNSSINSTSSNTIEMVGCPLSYDWCATTPRTNEVIFIGSIIIALGIGFPITGISLDILFSKILGPIQQGTMQGIYSGCGIGLQIIGPIFLSKIYTLTGPKYIWIFMLIPNTLGLNPQSLDQAPKMGPQKPMGPNTDPSCSLRGMLQSVAKRPPIIVPEDYPTSWKSIYIVTIVAIMGTLTTYCVMPMVYPYMKKLIPEATEETYGYMISISNACNAFSSIMAGFISNRFSSTKGALIFSKVLAILAGIVYFFIGTLSMGKLLAFFVSVGLFAVSSGAHTQYKTHIAMASKEVDRSKAMGWAALATSAGLILGPYGKLHVFNYVSFNVRNWYDPMFISLHELSASQIFHSIGGYLPPQDLLFGRENDL
uniref:Major facilitator superfamily (MFS) profile domain-containing protein n=1 Tax=Acrobeloides nanus TaxID=290746 RepID=A0A914DJS8_9BILA